MNDQHKPGQPAASIGRRLSWALLGLLGLLIVSAGASIFVLVEQYQAFKTLAVKHFDQVMAAAELTRDAEAVASEVFETLVGVNRSIVDDVRAQGNLLRIYETARARFEGEAAAGGLAEADHWQQPFFESLKTLRNRIVEERQHNTQKALATDDLAGYSEQVQSMPDGTWNREIQAALIQAGIALSSEKLGQIDRAREKALGHLGQAQRVATPAQAGVGQDIQRLAESIFLSCEPAIRSQKATLASARETRVLAQKLSGGVASYYTDLKRVAQQASQHHQEIAASAILVLLAFVLAVFIAGTWFVAYIRRRLVWRLNDLNAAMTAHVHGEPVPIPSEGDDEIATMGHAFEVFVTARADAERGLVDARRQAERASEAKSQFLANMSHELRTPLNAVKGFAELARQSRSPAERDEYLAKISNASEHLAMVINDILDFSKIEAGKLSLECVAFDLGEVMTSVSDMIAGTARRKGLGFHIQMDQAVPRGLEGDPLRLGQVLVNLAGNAVKFTQSGHVLIRVAEVSRTDRDSTLDFQVEDTGIGISEQQQAQLFAEFEQADASITRRFGGTGLGLAISRRLVDLMGGEIGLTSAHGDGATFFFRLTIRRQPDNRQRDFTVPSGIKGARILVADGDSMSRALFGQRLQALGFDHVLVETGQQAVDAVISAQPPFSLLFLDWSIVGPGYADTVSRILDVMPQSQIPLLAAVVSDEAEADELPGVAAVLVRPVHSSDLFNAILKAVGSEERRESLAAWGDTQPLGAAEQLRGVRILLVEDNPFNQEIAAKLLLGQGLIVDLANNGVEALHTVSAHPAGTFAAILMDVQMPEMDGLEATRRIRALDAGRDVPIIAMTAHALKEQRDACLAAGMDDHVSKPIDIRRLWETLARWVPQGGATVGAQGEVLVSDQPEAAASLPDLVGFDTADALRRLGGDRAAVLDMLMQFPRWARTIEGQFSDAWNLADWGGAQRAAHSLVGMAGNVGATEIARIARAIEDALRFGQVDDARPLVGPMTAAINRARAAVTQACHQDGAPEVPMIDLVQWSRIKPELARLRDLLDSNDMDAVSLFRQIVAKCDSVDHALLAVGQAIDDLEFSQALTELDNAFAKYNETYGE